jgi:cytochrome c-type biogenesis protein CcmH
MIAFAAIATLLSLAVFGLALWPLWRNSRRFAAGLLLALCVASVALYRIIGTPASITAQPPQTLEGAIAELRTALKQHPNEVEGWRLLGQTLTSQQKFDEARDAYARAAALAPDNADVLTEAAQSRMFADAQHKLDATATTMLQHALQVQPQHQRARWFLGVSQRQSGQPAQAAKTWEPLLTMVDAATAAPLREQINTARAEAGLPALPPAALPTPEANAVTVKVSLAADFASQARLGGNASVFVIARVPGGPPMPVAVQKHALSELPLTLTLSDTDSPMPTLKLSEMKEIEILARISASGNAMRSEGDIETAPVQVTLPAKSPVELIFK